MSFLCAVFVDLGTHHIESESLETLHTSPFQSIVVRKLCLGKWWFSGQRFLEFTYSSNFNHDFFLLSQFMKVSKFSRNCFKLFIIEWISLGWPKNLVWISHGTPYCFYRVSKILAVYPSWAFSVVSLLIWELIILNQNHLKLCTHDRISLSSWKSYVWATCDSVERGCWSCLMVLTLTTFFYLSQFMKVCKYSRNHLKLFTNDPKSLGWRKKIVCISHS